VLVRIGASVWAFSRADLKRFGADSFILRARAKSARTLFRRISGEWFRWTGVPRFDDSTAATPCEERAIAEALELPESPR